MGEGLLLDRDWRGFGLRPRLPCSPQWSEGILAGSPDAWCQVQTSLNKNAADQGPFVALPRSTARHECCKIQVLQCRFIPQFLEISSHYMSGRSSLGFRVYHAGAPPQPPPPPFKKQPAKQTQTKQNTKKTAQPSAETVCADWKVREAVQRLHRDQAGQGVKQASIWRPY